MTQPIERKLAAILADIAGYSRLIAPMMKALSPFSYGIRTGEVRALSPTPAMIIVGVMASPSVM
jgi:hypothetical protein